MYKIKTVTVIQKDVDTARKHYDKGTYTCEKCVIANAIRRVLKKKIVRMGFHTCYVNEKDYHKRYLILDYSPTLRAIEDSSDSGCFNNSLMVGFTFKIQRG